MKKVVFLGSIIVGGAVFAANSSEAVSGANDFNGVYVGAGVDFSHVANKANVTWNNPGINRPEICRKNSNSFGASTAIGYGQVFSNNVYVSGEFLVDICKDKKFSGTYEWGETIPYNGKIKGIVPSIALKLGYYVDSINTVFYGKFGAAYVKANLYDSFADVSKRISGNPNAESYGQDHNISKVVPVIGVGVEKKFGAFGVRLEGDYRFAANKNVIEGVRYHGAGQSAEARNRISGYTVRLMATYNFH